MAKKILIYGSKVPLDAETIKSAELISEAVPKKGGEEMTVNLDKSYKYYAVVAMDEAGNSSQLPLSHLKHLSPLNRKMTPARNLIPTVQACVSSLQLYCKTILTRRPERPLCCPRTLVLPDSGVYGKDQ